MRLRDSLRRPSSSRRLRAEPAYLFSYPRFTIGTVDYSQIRPGLTFREVLFFPSFCPSFVPFPYAEGIHPWAQVIAGGDNSGTCRRCVSAIITAHPDLWITHLHSSPTGIMPYVFPCHLRHRADAESGPSPGAPPRLPTGGCISRLGGHRRGRRIDG